MRRRRRTTRSILSHRVLAILGLVFLSAAWSVATTGEISESSQVAAAAEGKVTSPAPKTCLEAQGRASRLQGENDGPAQESITGLVQGKTELDKCFGAVLKDEARQKKQQFPYYIYQYADYECTGRGGSTNVSSQGVRGVTFAKKGVPPGKCDTKITSEKPGAPGGGQGADQGQGKGGMPELPKLPMGGGGQQPPPSPPPPPSENPCTAGMGTISSGLNSAFNSSSPCPPNGAAQGSTQIAEENNSTIGNLWDSIFGGNDVEPAAETLSSHSETVDTTGVASDVMRLDGTQAQSGTVADETQNQGISRGVTGFKSSSSDVSPPVPVSSLPQTVVSGIQNTLSGVASWLKNTFGLW